MDLGFALGGGVRLDGFLIGGDGHLAVLDAFQITVVEIWANGRQDVFDAPAAVLAGVIVIVTSNGQEINDALNDGAQLISEIGEGDRFFADHGFLKAGVVDEDGAGIAAGFYQGLGKGAPRVIPTEVEEGFMLQRAIRVQCVHAELEGDLLEGAGTFPDGNRRVTGLKVEEVVLVNCHLMEMKSTKWETVYLLINFQEM